MKDGMEVRMVEPQSPTEDDDDEDDDDENMKAEEGMLVQTPSKAEQFMDQYNGCPVLKFQVVNEMCNREGSEIVDAIMKVIGIKFKGRDGQVTHSQYVRVNLVDFEHPFFSRVWHGVHILNANSPLLTEKAKQRINKNKGSWPPEWFNPETIKKKLEFNDLVVTVAGISNVSAVTVHAYKRYKIGDVLIGFNFAPLVFRDEITGKLEVDMSLCHDVREQRGGGCEDLMVPENRFERAESTIRIVKSRDSDFLDSLQHNESLGIDQSLSVDGLDNP
ncbi:hypothetical protein HJC23_007699 [Cyclotella cryptica]|uniref:Uncharacterized protein n=1 Tax=Cyclotella cryptica TaxID=29204 RepID=A0ABD3PR51_9STRA